MIDVKKCFIKDIKEDVQMNNRIRLVAMCDFFVLILSFFAAIYIRFDFRFSNIPNDYLQGYKTMIIPLSLSYIFIYRYFKLYRSIWRFVSVVELQRIIMAMIVCWIPNTLFILFWYQSMPSSYWVMGWFLAFCGVVIVRFGYRFLRISKKKIENRFNNETENKYMIVGAGSVGRAVINEVVMGGHISGRIVCAIDDNRFKWGRYIDGVEIVGGRHDIVDAVERFHVTNIIYAIPNAPSQDKKEILEICNSTDCRLELIPSMYELVNGKVDLKKLRTVAIEDLLGRDQVIVDNKGIHDFINGKVVLVTGGGGSIGSELCRQVAKENPKRLIIFDIYENNAYEIEQELKRHMPELELVTLIGSVRNTSRVNYVMEKYRPDVVFHAAAHKHVPLMENSPNEAIKNNVIGTLKVTESAARYGVEKFILISTDKAVNPTNIMGASKRMCEMIIQMCDRKYPNTSYAAVRFGNVLGSNGSVVPLFKKQIEEGGPVTVTDPNMTRFFMTIPEAVALVIQAGIYACGGEIFVLDMGKPVKIDDMARKLIRLSGYVPDKDIKIVYTGLRPGEKMYEEILMNEEGMTKTANDLIYIAMPIEMNDELFAQELKKLDAASKNEIGNIRAIVEGVVPTYHAIAN